MEAKNKVVQVKLEAWSAVLDLLSRLEYRIVAPTMAQLADAKVIELPDDKDPPDGE